MSHSLLRLAPLSLSLSLVACAAQESETDEPISAQESALTEATLEGMLVAMAPVGSPSPATVAAAYRASFGIGGTSCATVSTDNLTFVTVTFACQGALATTGSIHLQLASAVSFEATADLIIGGVKVDGSLMVGVAASSEHTLEGEISIEGPRRNLVADVSATWTSNGTCVTYSASGSIVATGPRGSASSTFDVNAKTACQK